VSKLARIITASFVGIAAVIALLSQMPTALNAWCTYFGFWCTYEVTSPVIVAAIQGGNPCASQVVPVCVEATTQYRRLLYDKKSWTVVITQQAGPQKNGRPPASPDTASGWFQSQNDRNDASKICVTIFAVTGACEVKPSITGQLKAIERITIF
jgi:hypothetical protein